MPTPTATAVDALFGGDPLPNPKGSAPAPELPPEPAQPPAAKRVSRNLTKKQARDSASASKASRVKDSGISEAVQIRYRKFVTAYLKNPHNQSAAYRSVYPDASATTSWTEAGRLLRHPWVRAEIARRLDRVEKRADVSIGELVGNLHDIKGFDVRRLYGPVYTQDGAIALDDCGNPKMRLLDPWELDDDTAAALDGLKIKEGRYGRSIEYKSAGKINALELLGRYKGMLKDPEKPPIIANIQINF